MKKLLLFMWFLLLWAGTTMAGPPVFVPSDPDADPVGVPVDGGASLLLLAGGSYAVKKLKQRKQKNTKN